MVFKVIVFILVLFIASSAYALDYSLMLDGSQDYVRVGDDSVFDFSTGMTIEAWIKTFDTTSLRTIVSKWDDLHGDWSYIFKQWNGTDNLSIELSKGGHSDLARLIGVTHISTDTWIHVATTFDGQYAKLYVNGLLDGSLLAVGSIHDSSADLLIGAVNGWSGMEYFNGLIDEVRIWNYSRSQLDLLAWKDASLIGNESGLVGYWNFDEGSGLTIHDLTVNGNNGQFEGSVNHPQWVLSDGKPGSSDVVPEPASFILLVLGLFAYQKLKNRA